MPKSLPVTDKWKLEVFIISDNTMDKDELYWDLEGSGKFSVKIAYCIANGVASSMQDNDWKKIWKLKVPECAKSFFWLVKHERVLCNVERKRRHLESNDSCAVCNGAPESIIHLLRDCPKAAEVWEKLVGRKEARFMASVDRKDWLSRNINGKVKTRFNNEWPNLFTITVWWLWK